MVGGFQLFILVIGCDLALGPLISLVIYNTKKPRRELVKDYLVVGVLQLAALGYGISVVAQSRPVFVVFTKDRLEVVTAQELDGNDLREGKGKEFKTRSWYGPKLVGIQFPTDSKERNDLLFSAVAGKDAQLMPKYYVAYKTVLGLVKNKALPISLLAERHTEEIGHLQSAINDSGIAEAELRWLPVHHRFGFWTALIDAKTGYPVKYLPFDPY